jgi:hypothetical protein
MNITGEGYGYINYGIVTFLFIIQYEVWLICVYK